MDSAQIDKDAKIPQDVLQGLRDLGLFGLQIPEEYGGIFFLLNFTRSNSFNFFVDNFYKQLLILTKYPVSQ